MTIYIYLKCIHKVLNLSAYIGKYYDNEITYKI